MRIKAYMKEHSVTLRWWLMFSLIILGTVSLFIGGIVDQVNQADITKISFGICAIFFIFTIRTGIYTYRFPREKGITEEAVFQYRQKNEFGWFVSQIFLDLGMIGTLIGFIYTLKVSFAGMDAANIDTMKNALMSMSTGMGTALYTTAAGLICSLLLKLQLTNLDMHIDKVAQAHDLEVTENDT